MIGLRVRLPEGRDVQVSLLDEGLIAISLTGGKAEVHTVISNEQLTAINYAVDRLLLDKVKP